MAPDVWRLFAGDWRVGITKDDNGDTVHDRYLYQIIFHEDGSRNICSNGKFRVNIWYIAYDSINFVREVTLENEWLSKNTKNIGNTSRIDPGSGIESR